MEVTFILCDKCHTKIGTKDEPSPESFKLVSRTESFPEKIVCKGCWNVIEGALKLIDVNIEVRNSPTFPPQLPNCGKIIIG